MNCEKKLSFAEARIGPSNQRNKSINKLALTALSLAIGSSGVSAAIITQSATIGEPITFSASDTTANNLSVVNSAIRSLSFEKFNADTGVLTGVSSGLSINAGGEVRLSASGTSGGASPALQSSGFSQVSSNLLGVGSFGAINPSILSNSCRNPINGIGTPCFPTGVTNLNANASMTKVFTTPNSNFTPRTVAAGNLNSYVGSGALTSTLTVTNTVSMLGTPFTKQVTGATAALGVTGLSGAQSLNYTYLNHANASFSSGLDTNNITQDLSDGAFNFSIFNFGAADTTKLDSVSYSCTSGNCSAFGLTLLSFQDLLAGNHVSGSASFFDTDVAGTYSATYALMFSDNTAVGATSTHQQNSLLLNLTSSVASIPEPGTYSLLLAGLCIIGSMGLRRNQKSQTD